MTVALFSFCVWKIDKSTPPSKTSETPPNAEIFILFWPPKTVVKTQPRPAGWNLNPVAVLSFVFFDFSMKPGDRLEIPQSFGAGKLNSTFFHVSSLPSSNFLPSPTFSILFSISLRGNFLTHFSVFQQTEHKEHCCNFVSGKFCDSLLPATACKHS